MEAIQVLTEFYADRSADKRQDSWWRLVDPDTGKIVLRTEFGSVNEAVQLLSTNHQ